MDLSNFYANTTFSPAAPARATPTAPPASSVVPTTPAAPAPVPTRPRMPPVTRSMPTVSSPAPASVPVAPQPAAEPDELVAPPPATAPTKKEAGDIDLAKFFNNTVPSEYSLAIPAGYEDLGLVMDPVGLAEFTTVAKELGLSQSKAQALLALHAKSVFGAPKGKK